MSYDIIHAVRINEGAVADTKLRLGDAVLSTMTSLALAGAVHSYILILLMPVEDGDRKGLSHFGQGDRPSGIETGRADQVGQ
ncbi:hypothetical protein ACF07V_16695 [Streptomyces sp. NPDC015661]|uniref:hypothetical protein n=1 Tax=Streptomyces sp. NPDC015661 TaxID=3364961 RepID=UPI0036F54AFB